MTLDNIPYVGSLLFISRMGNFLAFFGYASARILYPKLATVELGMKEGPIGVVTAMILVGQGAGMVATSAGGWWRGKLWPLVVCILAMLAASLVVAKVPNPIAAGGAFFIMGFCLAVIYTGALYYGIQSRKNIGRNTGIHEALVATGNILGSLCGGAAAQWVSLQAPYELFAGLCALALCASGVIWVRRTK
jgi:hypothetical protein